MKTMLAKIFGMIAVGISVVSLLLGIAALNASAVCAASENTEPIGMGLPFKLWIYSVFVAALSLVFYTVDAILALVNARHREVRWLNIVLSIILLGGIPMLIFVGAVAKWLSGVIWYAYYLAMLVLEVVSIIRHRCEMIYW